MKAVVQSAVGKPTDVLEFIDIEDPSQPAPGEVLSTSNLCPFTMATCS